MSNITVLTTILTDQSSDMSGIHCSDSFYHVSGTLVMSPFWEYSIEIASLEFLPKHIGSKGNLDSFNPLLLLVVSA